MVFCLRPHKNLREYRSHVEGREFYGPLVSKCIEDIVGHTVSFGTFTWGPEVDALKDADYIYPCTACLTGFAKEYRNAGGSATFIRTGPHAAFMGGVEDARGWDEIDGMLYVLATKWWTDKCPMVDMSRELLYEKHPNSAEKTIREGAGYLTIYIPYLLLEIIADAAEAVGPENLDSQAIYNAAASFSLTVDGMDLYSFTGKTTRSVSDYFAVQEARKDGEDLFPVSDWIPVVIEP